MLKVLKFSATWCPPCRMLQPIWDEVVDEVHDVAFEMVDIDKDPGLARQYGISAVPTMVFLKDDNVAATLMGLRPKQDILDTIDNLR